MQKKHYIKICALVICASSGLQAAVDRLARVDERRMAYEVRVGAATAQTLGQPQVGIENQNSDEQNIAHYAGSFSKTLDHNSADSSPSTNGQENFLRLKNAMQFGRQSDFNAIERSGLATRKFANPQAALAFNMQGRDSSLLRATTPPTLDSVWAACEMLEDYWKALCRDVAWDDFGTGSGTDNDGSGGSLTNQAAAVLNDFGADYKGPRNGGVVDASVVFRGTGYGPVVGPYVSQFLLLDLHEHNQSLLARKQWLPVAQCREFGVSWDDCILIQNGAVPKGYVASDFNGQRYPATPRDLGTLVHYDGDTAYGPYYNAVNILINNGFPFATNFPYNDGAITNEGAFATLGSADLCCALGSIATTALKSAWANKWRAYRRLRPEAMAALVHHSITSGTNPYGLNAALFATHAGIDTLTKVLNRNTRQANIACDPQQLLTPAQAQTYLLGQMYPEGSPTHPSYPAGHAVMAGAYTTIIKAYVDDTALMRDYITPVKVNKANPQELVALSAEGEDQMTVGGELDKLASNIALARDIAGVHYRADGDYGIELGERVAIAWLQDQCRTYQEQGFTGFELTKRNGQRVRITEIAETVIG